MFTVFAAVAELERNYIAERARQGVAVAKAEGKYKRRRPKQFLNLNKLQQNGEEEKSLL